MKSIFLTAAFCIVSAFAFSQSKLHIGNQSLLKELLFEEVFVQKLRRFLNEKYKIKKSEYKISFESKSTTCISKSLVLEPMSIGICTLDLEISSPNTDVRYAWITVNANTGEYVFFELDSIVP